MGEQFSLDIFHAEKENGDIFVVLLVLDCLFSFWIYLVSTACWKFRDSHLTRALKAAKKAGYCVDKAMINANGDIVLTFDSNREISDNDNASNPWDQVYASRQKRPA